MACRVFFVVCSIVSFGCAERSTTNAIQPPIWGSAYMGDAGRSGQGLVVGPRIADGMDWSQENHLVDVTWRWEQPEGLVSSSFYYGVIDAQGAMYYVNVHNGAGPFIVHKIDGKTGTTVWTAQSIPRPYYADYAGVDHLLVGSGVDDPGVFLIAGSKSTLADCGWVARLSGQTGARTWWVNNTNAITNALLSKDASLLYVCFFNGTLSVLDAVDGTVMHVWDLATAKTLMANTSYSATLVEDSSPTLPNLRESQSPPVLVFAGDGNYTAVDATTGAQMYRIPDPVNGHGGTIAASPLSGVNANNFFIATGSNAAQGAGVASVNVRNGKVDWSTILNTVTISSIGVPTTQGWEWTIDYSQTGYQTVSLRSMTDGSRIAMTYFPQRTTISFGSRPAVSADGLCVYLFGSVSSVSSGSSQNYLFAFCYNETDHTIANEWLAPMTGLDTPDRPQIALGPADGQLTIFHSGGVVVLQTIQLHPPANAPQGTPGSGEVIALSFVVPLSTCTRSTDGAMLLPAILHIPSTDDNTPPSSNSQSQSQSLSTNNNSKATTKPQASAGVSGATPEWVTGSSVSSPSLFKGCAGNYRPAIHRVGRKAWVLFTCIGEMLTYVAEIDFGQSGSAVPKITNVCQWPRSRRTSMLFFDDRINASAPYYLDDRAQFGRSFYRVEFPSSSTSFSSIDGNVNTLTMAPPKQCLFTKLWDLVGVNIFLPLVYADATDTVPTLYFSGVTPMGISVTRANALTGSQIGPYVAQLPCNTGSCYYSASFTVAAQGRVFSGGRLNFFSDVPSASLIQTTQFDDTNPPTTYTGYMSTKIPTTIFPTSTIAVDVLPDPTSNKQAAWLQSFEVGSRACLVSANLTSLQSVAIVGHTAADAVLVVNTSVPACPVNPSMKGVACLNSVYGHVEAFTMASPTLEN